MESLIDDGRFSKLCKHYANYADYANPHSKNYIPDKNIDKKILTENLMASVPQELPVLDDFVKTLWYCKGLFPLITKWKSFRETFTGCGSIVTTRERIGRRSKRVVWSCGSACRHTCYVDWTNKPFLGPSITINIAYKLLKQLENAFERPK